MADTVTNIASRAGPATPRPSLQSRRISYESVKSPRDLSLGALPTAAIDSTSTTLPAGQRSVPAKEPAGGFAQTVSEEQSNSPVVEKALGAVWPGGEKVIWEDGEKNNTQVRSKSLHTVYRGEERSQEPNGHPRMASYNNTATLPGSTGRPGELNSYDAASAFPSAVAAPSNRRDRGQPSMGGTTQNGPLNDLDALSAGFRGLRIVPAPQASWQPPRPSYSADQGAPYVAGYYGQSQPDLVAAAVAATAHGAGPYFDALNWQAQVGQNPPSALYQHQTQNVRRPPSTWHLPGMPNASLALDRVPSRSPVQQYSPTLNRATFFNGHQEALSPIIDYGRPLAPAGLVSPYGYPGSQLGQIGLPGQSVSGGRIYRSPLLEEFRSNRHKRWELEDLRGNICEFATDQLGSRHIQTKLEAATAEEKAMVFAECLPALLQLCTDTFGNYVCQKLFEVADHEQKIALVDAFRGNVLRLSLQSYACRVVQKAIEQINLEQQVQLVSELDGHVLKCARDQNANHTLQKIISCMPSEKIAFIADACLGQVFALATHPYGCRVLQRILENMRNLQPLIDELIKYAQNLIQDQYGNYLAQHLLEHGPPAARSAVIARIRGQIFNLSRHKFASNVVDKAILCSGEEERCLLTDEILADPSAVGLMLRDPFANYPLQKFLLTVQGPQREILLSRTAEALAHLKRYSPTYSKHLMAIEKWVLSPANHIVPAA